MSEDETVEARLRRLEDLEEIRGLVMAYRRHLDSGDLRAFSELFSEHGVWVGNTGHGRGPQGIRTMLEQGLAPNPPAPGPTRFHLVSDPVIDLDGDRATGGMLWALVSRGEAETPTLTLVGHYVDRYVREAGRWRFERREAHTDIPLRTLEGAEAAGRPARLPGAPPAGPGGAVEARLRRLEDRDAIRRLFEEYRRALDERDFDAYTGLFAEDGVFVTNTRIYVGRKEIREMLEQLPGSGADGPRGGSVHLLANPVVDVDGDGATAEATWAFIVRGESDTPALRMLGRYRDVLRREGGTWKFVRRDARADIPSS